MGRRILFITSDQQRYDSLGVTGGEIARTPNLDALARQGILYRRAHPQNVVCMPSRATMITGQHVSTHGVWMNGVPLPAEAPNVARVLRDAGYATSLIGKAHFEPFLDPFLRFTENRLGPESSTDGAHRGFDHMELATHSPRGWTHYAQWLARHHPDQLDGFYPVLDLATMEVNHAVGGDSGAPQISANGISRELYHTDWIADRAIAWLDAQDDDTDWFCWVSFPDPHHPWDPPEEEMRRVDWRELDLPPGYIDDRDTLERLLDERPRHWRAWWEGQLVSNYEAPAAWVPATLTSEQVREINARVHVENELVDEAVGRILAQLRARGWDEDTDVVFTTDHGEFQGDHSLLFKGPYHVDALLRLPLIYRPAPSTGVAPSVVDEPVGLLDLAPTFCTAAGVEVPTWMEGQPLPTSPQGARAQGRERVLTEWDSLHPTGVEVHLRSIFRDGLLCTTYRSGTVHDGTEGELYDTAEDPLQRVNRWADPAYRSLRKDLIEDLVDHQPAPTGPRRPVQAPV